MTRFRATRSFLRSPGVDVTVGTLLELDDREAALLVSLQCVEPADARDRKRVVRHERVTWEPAREFEPLVPGTFAPPLRRIA